MLDVTRLSRKQRRSLQAQSGVKIQGRNLGFKKELHGSIENYNKLRQEEIDKETKELNDRDKS